MPTRGLLGVKQDGMLYATYVPFDAYPSGVGLRLVKFLQEIDSKELAASIREMIYISDGAEMPTMETARLVRNRLDDQSLKADTFFHLLGPTFGDLERVLKAGVMIDATRFGGDSLHCEWGWIVNLDDGVLEIYRGFQKQPHDDGPWSNVQLQRGGYYGIRKVQGFFLDSLPRENTLRDLERIDYGVKVR